MSKTDQLESLFTRWVNAFPSYNGKFKKDGIIDESYYDRQKIKLLFIAKEANDPSQTEGDYRDWWHEEVKYSFSHRICEWAYGIMNNFPPINSLDSCGQQRIEVMKSIAFMNLKKSGGAATVDHDKLGKVVDEERSYILEEIGIISPDILIGGVGSQAIWLKLFQNIAFKRSGFDIDVARVGKTKIIDYYHPSYRVPRAMSYAHLSRIVGSQPFRDL
ncbi:MAG TPA: hypothetical protein VFM15_07685 [Gammaproteobacteria bacterium]|nr:hypothetical protein [Gammaproteobacteria bacterium]